MKRPKVKAKSKLFNIKKKKKKNKKKKKKKKKRLKRKNIIKNESIYKIIIIFL